MKLNFNPGGQLPLNSTVLLHGRNGQYRLLQGPTRTGEYLIDRLVNGQLARQLEWVPGSIIRLPAPVQAARTADNAIGGMMSWIQRNSKLVTVGAVAGIGLIAAYHLIEDSDTQTQDPQ